MLRYESYGTSYVIELDIGKVTDLELIEPEIPLFNWHISPCWPRSWIFFLDNLTDPSGDSNMWFEHAKNK